MQVITGFSHLQAVPEGAVVTIGNFDGVHLGHQEIFSQVRDHAKRSGGTAVAVSFRPHPQHVLRPETGTQLLNTYEEKLHLVEKLGIDLFVEEPFSREFSNTPPEQFFRIALLEKLKAKALYLGYDFSFGKERAGSIQTLQILCEQNGVELHVVPALQIDGRPVSSSRIREALDQGDIENANRLLGRAFFLRGLVWRGQGRGRQLGFPTANLQLEARKVPRLGVYITEVEWQGKTIPSITNVGRNPTFEHGDTVFVETHIFGFDETIYGDTLELRFRKHLRPEQKFNGPQALVEQIKKDCAEARKFHGI